MENAKNSPSPAQEQADLEEVCRLVAAGQRVTDPELLKRIQERSERAQVEAERLPAQDLGVQLIRELRGPLDEEQERELTLAQRGLLRKGEARLKDPETGEEYVLVPVAEYERLRGAGR